MANEPEPEQPAPAPATPWWRRLLAFPGWLDRQLRRVPDLARRYPGLLVAVGAIAAVVALLYGRFDQGVIVPALAALAGVWIGQSLSARQAREEAARTEERLVAERRAAFQARTLNEMSVELERMRDAAKDVRDVDYKIRDNKDPERTAELVQRRNESARVYGRAETRVRILRARIANPDVVVVVNKLGRYCREVVISTPQERLESRRHGVLDQDAWDAPYMIDPAFDEAAAVIGKALQDLGG